MRWALAKEKVSMFCAHPEPSMCDIDSSTCSSYCGVSALHADFYDLTNCNSPKPERRTFSTVPFTHPHSNHADSGTTKALTDRRDKGVRNMVRVAEGKTQAATPRPPPPPFWAVWEFDQCYLMPFLAIGNDLASTNLVPDPAFTYLPVTPGFITITRFSKTACGPMNTVRTPPRHSSCIHWGSRLVSCSALLSPS